MIKLPEPMLEFMGTERGTIYAYTEDQLKQVIRDALDEAALLFSQDDYVEYREAEVRATILKLKEKLK